MTGTGGTMSGTEEVKEQTEVVMEDAEKSIPSTQQEVVFTSCSLGDAFQLYPCHFSSDSYVFLAGGSCKEEIWWDSA